MATFVLLLVTLAAQPLRAQWSQAEACPGWNNPTSFVVVDPNNTGRYYYSGQTGEKVSGNCGQAPVPRQGITGMNLTTSVTASNLLSATSGQSGYGCTFPGAYNSQASNYFAIYSTEAMGSNRPAIDTNGKDPNTYGGTNTGSGIKYYPLQYNSSPSAPEPRTNISKVIRVGDCGAGTKANALYYNMRVNSSNALLFIYYACVIEVPSGGPHGNTCDPAFIIRVCKKVGNTWKQVSPTNWLGTPSGAPSGYQCDTLCYMVPSTPSQSQPAGMPAAPSSLDCGPTTWGTVRIGENGWHLKGSWNGGVAYKEWTKVAINLASLMYQDVRIEVLMSDCCYSAHYAYAYVTGECRPMEIEGSGCPPGESTEVTTLTAPSGMKGYAWYTSEYGAANPAQRMFTDDEETESTKYFTFRMVRDTILEGEPGFDTAHIYKAKADDFRISYTPNLQHTQNIPVSTTDDDGNPIDSVGQLQTFRCSMKSAIDPNKPYWADLYVTVTNIKPTMDVDTSLVFCGGDVILANNSYVPGNQTLVNRDSTVWSFYNNSACLGTPDSVKTGTDTVWLRYPNGQEYGVRVRTNIDETQVSGDDAPAHNECYSEKTYKIKPLPLPKARMNVSEHVLCDDARTTITDMTTGATRREWIFRSEDDEDFTHFDTLRGSGAEHRDTTRSFTHAVEPIILWVTNDLTGRDTADWSSSNRIPCATRDTDTVAVFLHPNLLVVGDTIVCQGSRTDATVSVEGVDNCTYEWYTSPNGGTSIATGPNLQVVPYASTATYYVKVTSQPQGCVAWDSIHAYLVTPTLSMAPADGRICPGDQVHLFGGNADSYSWYATPADATLVGQEELAEVVVTPAGNTTYKLVGHGSNGCNADTLYKSVTVLPLPVPRVETEPGIVDTDEPTVVLHDRSQNSVGARWAFDDGTSAEGTSVTHTFNDATGVDSVFATLIPHNELGCEVSYRFGIPVNLYTAWLPNIFTPGSEDVNSRFRLYTINDYEYFHIYIFNRRGERVFESSNPTFEWDGTDPEGRVLPQGTYVYVCRYRKPGMFTLSEQKGTVTLLR